ncbi:putative Nitrosoguanidine resistance protein SNG1 [Glarea lozoyensis 74030]|uniref:Putative Nitrosoguanidine resistance protein SNG1 n=1 Tax=Glarea lozoyensis (strain ATCC 74030 / MF5533) TaxID=1104152 RepID=H0EF61_GLAL7|nr:putative Nitrosoguanidine resistance protein SNG1 [Glarea lozoyensis 74030]
MVKMSKDGLFNSIMEKKLYPRAHENRKKVSDPSFQGPRKAFLLASAKSFVMLQVLFLGLFSYIFGAIYHQSNRVHNIEILFVDYDGGAVGNSFQQAYQTLKGPSFPTLIQRTPTEYPSAINQIHHVCNVDYWASIYIANGASQRVEAALTGLGSSHNQSDIAYYIWNEARYPAVVDQVVSSTLLLLSSTARIIYAKQNWTTTTLSPTAHQTFTDPWHLTSINLQPTAQGARLIYNTLVIVFLLIQQFFFLGTINALYDAFQIYTRLNPHRIFFFRWMLSAIYCLVGSLCVTGAIWAFRSGWQVNGNQFALTWVSLWLFAHANFLTLDVFTAWVPAPLVPMALITWVVLNVASVLLPFELSSPFYKWGYAVPAHCLYNTLVDIWSRGCNPVLYYALPVLFAYEVSSSILCAIGVHRRCHYAMVKMDQDAEALQHIKASDETRAMLRSEVHVKLLYSGASIKSQL